MQIQLINYPITVQKRKINFLTEKSARIKPLDILKHLVAFSNAEGGQKWLQGLSDDGTITGFNYKEAHSIDEYNNIFLTELKETPINPKLEILDVKNKWY